MWQKSMVSQSIESWAGSSDCEQCQYLEARQSSILMKNLRSPGPGATKAPIWAETTPAKKRIDLMIS